MALIDLVVQEEQVVVLENKVLVQSANVDDRDLPHTSPGSAHYPQPNLVSQYEGILHDALLPHILPVSTLNISTNKNSITILIISLNMHYFLSLLKNCPINTAESMTTLNVNKTSSF